jgi:hypothetical protein
MTLTEQAIQFSKTSYFNRTVRQHATPSNGDQPQILSFHVYSAQRLSSLAKPTQQDRHLPPIDVQRRKSKRPPLHHSSVQHLRSSQWTPTDLSQVTGRGIRSNSSALLKEMQRVNADENRPVPPPSPSDDQVEQFFCELHRTGLSMPQIAGSNDGYVPYRLPALHPPIGLRQTAFPLPSKPMKSTLATFRQTFF